MDLLYIVSSIAEKTKIKPIPFYVVYKSPRNHILKKINQT